MRLDHTAYRTADRVKTAKFFIDAFGYRIQQEFSIEFDDGTKAQCIALEPPEKNKYKLPPWTFSASVLAGYVNGEKINPIHYQQEYHLPPEIFVSDGPPGSIVGDWVAARNGIGGIHHMAYQVDNVDKIVEEWKVKGYAEFSSELPLKCPGLTQIFTKPSVLTGVIYEFIVAR